MERLLGKILNKEGSIMIVLLLMLAFLTLIGISATTTTEIEVQIAGNEKFQKIAFYNADSGVYSAPKLISECFETGAEPDAGGVTYLDSDGKFYREIMGFDVYDLSRDIRFVFDGYNVDVDVKRLGQESLAGGSAEFASGAEGVGGGSSGGVAIYYEMDSLGEGPNQTLSNISAVYRKVIGVAGGL
ncbi:MAG: hypothetical protein JRJ29_04305 [Deltaproteobacteria bacterium]|nr:hypothetical protein [Deltaproteobacteria bacterium]